MDGLHAVRPRLAAALGNELREGREYDTDGRVIGYSVEDSSLGQDVLRRSLEWGDKRNLTKIEDLVNGANTETFSYTANGFLASAEGLWGEFNFQTDGVGNITQRSITLGSTTSTDTSILQAGSNRLSSITTGGVPSRSFQSDAAGNMIQDTGRRIA